MTDNTFNEFGVHHGTKVLGILDEQGFLVDTTVVDENETEENMLLFAEMTPEFVSYVILTDPSITLGYKWDGTSWMAPVVTLPDLSDLFPEGFVFNTQTQAEAEEYWRLRDEEADALDGP